MKPCNVIGTVGSFPAGLFYQCSTVIHCYIFNNLAWSISGIEANDVSALLEQFLEYEEKQGLYVRTCQL